MPPLTSPERDEFLATPGILCRIATVRPDGAPSVTPIWYLYEEGKVFVTPRAHILRDSGARLLAVPAGEEVADAEAVPVDLGARSGASFAEPDPERPAFVLYTSGTTGAPKGAVIPRSAVAAGLDGLADAWRWNADDTLVHGLPLFHVHGLVLGVVGVLRRGGSLRHLGTLSAVALSAAVGSGATMVFGVPTQYHRLATELEADLAAAKAIGRARLLVSGSAALTAVDHVRLRRATGLAVRERYGLTETLILTAARAGEDPEPGTVGRPLAGTEVRLVPLTDGPDGTTDPAADHAADGLGAVEARGPGLFSGYLNRPDATAAAMTPDVP